MLTSYTYPTLPIGNPVTYPSGVYFLPAQLLLSLTESSLSLSLSLCLSLYHSRSSLSATAFPPSHWVNFATSWVCCYRNSSRYPSFIFFSYSYWFWCYITTLLQLPLTRWDDVHEGGMGMDLAGDCLGILVDIGQTPQTYGEVTFFFVLCRFILYSFLVDHNKHLAVYLY